MGARQLPDDAPADVTAVRDIAFVPEAFVISVCHRCAMLIGSRLPAGAGAENPKPGNAGTTTVNASFGSAP